MGVFNSILQNPTSKHLSTINGILGVKKDFSNIVFYILLEKKIQILFDFKCSIKGSITPIGIASPIPI